MKSKTFQALAAVFLISLVSLTAQAQTLLYHTDQSFTYYEEVVGFSEMVNTPGFSVPENNAEFTGLGAELLVNSLVYTENPTTNDDAQMVGESRNVCTRVSADPMVENPTDPRNEVRRISRCELVVELESGTILATGVFYENDFEAFKPQYFSVVGGTGAYFGAVGQVKLTQVVYPGMVVKLEGDIRAIWKPEW